jgi:hypothetical protein
MIWQLHFSFPVPRRLATRLGSDDHPGKNFPVHERAEAILQAGIYQIPGAKRIGNRKKARKTFAKLARKMREKYRL